MPPAPMPQPFLITRDIYYFWVFISQQKLDWLGKGEVLNLSGIIPIIMKSNQVFITLGKSQIINDFAVYKGVLFIIYLTIVT